MEEGPPRYNPNNAAAQPKVIPPPTMPGIGNSVAQPAVVPGKNIPAPPLPSSQPPLMKLQGYILRGLPILLTFLATVLMGAAKYTDKSINESTLEYIYTEFKATDFSALVYFTVVNALVCAYSVASLVMSLVMKDKAMPLEMIISIADLLVVTFLLTSNGAASAISVLLDNDSNTMGGFGACRVLKGFCAQIQGAIFFSMLASVAYLVLIFLRIFVLHK